VCHHSRRPDFLDFSLRPAMDTKDQSFAKLQQVAFRIVANLNTEIDYLMFFKGKQKRDFLTDTYFVRYAFGMIDAVTTLCGLELRAKIGIRIIAVHYIRYLILEFELNQTTALAVFQSVRKFYDTEEGQRDAAILDGGSDGVLVLQGEIPQKLLKHFGVDTNDDTPLTQTDMEKLPAQLEKFETFFNRDRWSDHAVREGERAVQAIIAGDIAI
jgi:hypothetical protein